MLILRLSAISLLVNPCAMRRNTSVSRVDSSIRTKLFRLMCFNIDVISSVRKQYPNIHITAAVSNISFNLPVRKMINLGFTVLAMNAGLDSAILDPTNRDMMGIIYATEALLGQDDYCMEYIEAYREGLFGPVKN